ncbi:MAG: pyridoxamine 5'-phosphate oxidase family protein [Pseudomonadota bacterium]
MKNKSMETRLSQEVLDFIHRRRSLQIASLGEDGIPFASYAPFAIGDNCLYVLLSDIAIHGVNLSRTPDASVLIIEDEDSATELFARIRVNYTVRAQQLAYEGDEWQTGVDALAQRHGERPRQLSQLADFRLFRLTPQKGRFVKGFGKAYTLAGGTLAGRAIEHLRDGHKSRPAA